MIIKNAKVFGEDFKFAEGSVSFKDGVITALNAPDDDSESFDAQGGYVIPGLIDIHTHGADGHDFCEGTDEAILTMSRYLGSNGITSFTAAGMTLDNDTLRSIFSNMRNYRYQGGARIRGINMEGPFFSAAKKGAQNGAYLKNPDIKMFNELDEAAGGLIKLVCLAPELEGAAEFIKEVSRRKRVSIAHTESDYDTAVKAFGNGASHVTHMFNAMPNFLHRAPAVIGAAADCDATVEIISDGIHLHPAVVRLAFKLYGTGKIVLISDSMMACGKDDGEYELGGQKVFVKGNLATLEGGTIAGSVTNLMKCMKTAVSFGIKLEDAVRAATINPAAVIGLEDRIGSISTGKDADLVVLDGNLDIKAVFVGGVRQ